MGGVDKNKYKEMPKSDDIDSIVSHFSEEFGGSYYATPISILLYQIITSFSMIDEDLKWYAFVGVTGTFQICK